MKKFILTILALNAVFFNLFAEYQTQQNIEYGSNKDSYSRERCRWDIHHPVDTTGLPVIVWFHGGGLTGGNRFIPEELKNAGYVVAPAHHILKSQIHRILSLRTLR